MNFIYETPWWLPTGLVIAGMVLLLAGNNRLNRRMIRSGLGLMLAGVLVAALSYFLESPREIVLRQTRALVSAVEKRDWKAMASLLQPDVTLVGVKGREAVVDLARDGAERFRLKQIYIRGIEAAVADPDITVTMQISGHVMDTWVPETNWKLDWEQTPTGWLLGNIESQGGPALTPDSIERSIRGR